MLVKLVHLKNPFGPILLTLLPIITLVKPTHSWNAPSPIVVTELVITMLDIRLHP